MRPMMLRGPSFHQSTSIKRAAGPRTAALRVRLVGGFVRASRSRASSRSNCCCAGSSADRLANLLAAAASRARSRSLKLLISRVESARGHRQPDRRGGAGAVQLHPGAAGGRVEARVRHQLPAAVRCLEPEQANQRGRDLLQRRADRNTRGGDDRIDLRAYPHRTGKQRLGLRLRGLVEQRNANRGTARRTHHFNAAVRLLRGRCGQCGFHGRLGLHLPLDLADRLQPQLRARLPLDDVAWAQEPLAVALLILPTFLRVFPGAQRRLGDGRLLLGHGERPGSGSLRGCLARRAGHRELLGRASSGAYVAGLPAQSEHAARAPAS